MSNTADFDFANRTAYPLDNALEDIISVSRRNGVPVDNQRADAYAYERTRPYHNMTEDRRIEREERERRRGGGKTKQKKSKKNRKTRKPRSTFTFLKSYNELKKILKQKQKLKLKIKN